MIKEVFKQAFLNTHKAFRQLLFYAPQVCSICNIKGKIICDDCAMAMPKHQNILCDKCGRQIKEHGLCINCTKYERPYEKGVIALFYQDKPRLLMQEFKYFGKRDYAYFFANEIYLKIKSYSWDIEIITSVPMHTIKLFGKGYNPPELIAKELSNIMNIPYKKKLLKRIRYTKSMALLKNIKRMEHVEKNFGINKDDCKNKSILIIDDVSTTGATLHICSKILMDNGAKCVYVAAACGDDKKFFS